MKIGEIASFQAKDGKIITGKVVRFSRNVCTVASFPLCAMYSDGLFRFHIRDRVK